MGGRRTDAQEQVAELLRKARTSLGLSLAFLSRLDEDTQYLEVIETSIPFMNDGITQDRSTSFCQLILDERLPPVIADVRDYPEALALPAAKFPRIRKYVSVPVVLSDGTLYGTFCGAGLRADRDLQERDRALMEVLASAAAMIIEPGVQDERRRSEIESRLIPVMNGSGPTIVYQPIVDLASGQRVGAEALSRFPAEWGLPPDVCFEQAHSVGLGDRLEVLALGGAVSALESVPGYIAMNISPSVVMRPEGRAWLEGLPLDRILLELSEHIPVADYDALNACLSPLRYQGLRLAIDDVGSGFSSLRHIVLTRPDVIKLDRSIVAGACDDAVLSTLIASMVQFASSLGAATVAEGIETPGDAEHLASLGVTYGQGWHFGRPGPAEQLDP